jgi:hypothetical protein
MTRCREKIQFEMAVWQQNWLFHVMTTCRRSEFANKIIDNDTKLRAHPIDLS